MRQFGTFCVVGAFGFVADASLFWSFIQVTDSVIPSRVLAFWFASCITWLGNRLLTFRALKQSEPVTQLIRHLASVHLSGTINLIVFYSASHLIILPLAFCLGIAAGLAGNYMLSAYFVFPAPKTGGRTHADIS